MPTGLSAAEEMAASKSVAGMPEQVVLQLAKPEAAKVWFLIMDPFHDPGYLLLEGPPPADILEDVMCLAETGDITLIRLNENPCKVEYREADGWSPFKPATWETVKQRWVDQG